jgi:hypothetical protein
MAIFYYPFPNLLTPSVRLTQQYQIGDYFVQTSGAAVVLTKGTLTNTWKSYPATSSPAVAGAIAGAMVIPPITASSPIPITTATSSQYITFTPVTAYGGAAIATSYISTGTFVGLSVSVTPSLPQGMTVSSSSTVATITGLDSISRYFNSVSVTVAGTPVSTLAETPYTVTITDASGQTAQTSFKFIVKSNSTPLVVTQAVANKVLAQNTSTSFTPVTASGGTGLLTYAISPALPTGLSFNSLTGLITGTPTALISLTTFTVTVSDTVGQTGTQTFDLTVNAVPVVTTLADPNKTLIQKLAITPFTPVTGSGGTGALTYTISPVLPTGLSINSATGQISGTPSSSTASQVPYTVTVTDSNSSPQSSSKTFTLTVTALPSLTTTVLVPSTTLTRNFAVTEFTPVAGAGGYGNTAYLVSPALPSGLAYNTSTGVISGTPTVTSGAVSYSVVFSDQANQSSTGTFSLTIASAALVVTTATATSTILKDVAIAGFIPITATGGFGTFSYAISPTLPTGLSFNTTTGQITGTATVASGATTYTVTVTDQTPQSSSKTFSLTVAAPMAVTATTVVSVATLTRNSSFTPFAPITAVGGYGTLNYAINPTLSAGLLFGAGTGQISGTPTAFRTTTTYAVTVKDTLNQASTSSFNLYVTTPALVTTLSVPSITQYYNIAITEFTPVTVTGGTGIYAYTISPSLPTGLLFNTATSVVSGTPTAYSSTATYAVTVTDTLGQSGSKSFSLAVLAPPAVSTKIVTTSTALVRLVTNANFTPVAASGGYGNITFFVTPSLPSGLSFNSSNGKISGIGNQLSSTATYTVLVTDSVSQTSSTQFSLSVINAPIKLVANAASYSLTEFTTLAATATVTASGGSGVYSSYSIAPALPTELSFNTANSQISGTPTVAINTSSYTVTVNDDAGASTTASFSIYIVAPSPLTTVTNASSVTATVNAAITAVIPIGAIGGINPLSYAVSPSLPTGLSFSTTTGKITGTPTVLSSTSTYTVTVTDAASTTVSGTFSLAVKAVPITITRPSANNVAIQYQAITPVVPVLASGGYGALTYSVSPALPASLDFNTTTGQLKGTASEIISSTVYTVTVTDTANQTASGTFTLTVIDATPAPLLAVLQSPIVSGNLSVAVNSTPVIGSGGVPTYTYAISPTTLPTGLSFNSSTGAISGTPTGTASSGTYIVTVTDSVPQTKQATFSLNITALVITASSTQNNVNVVSNTPSTSPDTGAAVIVGGLGVGGNINVGSTATSTGSTTGAVVVTGGLGVGGNINVGSSAASINTFTGAVVILGGLGVGGSINATAIYQNGYAVSTLTNIVAGAGITITSTTGTVTVVNTSTLQSVTNNGNSTSNAISITNSGTALTVTGKVTHGGLIPTAGTNIDQIYTTTKSLTLTPSWQATGISGTALTTGSYMVQIIANDLASGGEQVNTYYTGAMSWYSGATGETSYNEIVLHRAGGAQGRGNIFLRVAEAATGTLSMQIAGTTTNTGVSNYIFSFRRMI